MTIKKCASPQAVLEAAGWVLVQYKSRFGETHYAMAHFATGRCILIHAPHGLEEKLHSVLGDLHQMDPLT